MMHSNNPIIKHKAGLLNLAEELGNVSQACRVMGFQEAQEILFIDIKKLSIYHTTKLFFFIVITCC